MNDKSNKLLELKPVPQERRNEWTEVISIPLKGKYVTELNVLIPSVKDYDKQVQRNGCYNQI